MRRALELATHIKDSLQDVTKFAEEDSCSMGNRTHGSQFPPLFKLRKACDGMEKLVEKEVFHGASPDPIEELKQFLSILICLREINEGRPHIVNVAHTAIDEACDCKEITVQQRDQLFTLVEASPENWEATLDQIL